VIQVLKYRDNFSLQRGIPGVVSVTLHEATIILIFIIQDLPTQFE
jgi:hypothetical protein